MLDASRSDALESEVARPEALRAALKSADASVLALMAQQYGLVTRPQALAVGMTQHQIRWRMRTGQWALTAPGVYRHASVPRTQRSELLGLCLAHGVLASHRSAAAVHRIDGYSLDCIEVVVAEGSIRRIPGARLHHSRQMHLAQPVVRQGIPVTGLARTVLDLAAVVNRTRLDSTIDALLRERRLRLSDLCAVLTTHAQCGRNGSRPLKAALMARTPQGGVPLSDWSRMTADLLEGAHLPRPVFEHRITDTDGSLIAQVDLAYPDQRLAIELDSVKWHFNLESFVSDPRRRNQASIAGWIVLTFTWNDYAKHPETLCATVARALQRTI